MKQNAGPRIDDIEALRAIAVIFTLITHFHRLFPWGSPVLDVASRYLTFWTGVDLFFAISGFVIARDVLRRLEDASSNEQFWRISMAFWIKRIYRIWPTSWLWIGLIVIGSLAFRKTGLINPPSTSIPDFISVILQVQNFHLQICNSTPSPHGCQSDAGPWWSLSLEEQFYIALPIVTFIFRKKLPLALGILVVAQIFLPRPSWSLAWAVRTDALCLGVLLAIFSRTDLYKAVNPIFMRKRTLSIPIALLLLFLLAAAPTAGTHGVIVPFTTGLVAIVSIILVFIASFNGDYIAGSGYLKPVFMWLGARSYAIYLIHIPTTIVTRAFWRFVEPSGTIFGPNFNLRFLLVWMLLTGCLAELNFRFLEQPLRRKGREIARRLEGGLSLDDAPTANSQDVRLPRGKLSDK